MTFSIYKSTNQTSTHQQMHIKLTLHSPRYTTGLKLIYSIPSFSTALTTDSLLSQIYTDFGSFFKEEGDGNEFDEREYVCTIDGYVVSMTEVLKDVLHDGDRFDVYKRTLTIPPSLQSALSYLQARPALIQTEQVRLEQPLVEDRQCLETKEIVVFSQPPKSVGQKPFEGTPATKSRNARRRKARALRKQAAIEGATAREGSAPNSTAPDSTAAGDLTELEELRARLVARAEQLAVDDDSNRDNDGSEDGNIGNDIDTANNESIGNNGSTASLSSESSESIEDETQNYSEPVDSSISNEEHEEQPRKEGSTLINKIQSAFATLSQTIRISTPKKGSAEEAMPALETDTHISTPKNSDEEGVPSHAVSTDRSTQSPETEDRNGLADLVQHVHEDPPRIKPPYARKPRTLIAEAIDCLDHTNRSLKIPPFPFKQVNYTPQNSKRAFEVDYDNSESDFHDWTRDDNNTASAFEGVAQRQTKRRRKR